MLGYLNPNMGKIWTKTNVGLKMQLINVQLKVKVLSWVKLVENIFFNPTFGLSIFYPNLGSNNPALFRV